MDSFDEIEDWREEMELFARHIAFQRRIYRKSLEFYANAEEYWNRPAGRLNRWILSLLGVHVQTKEEYDQRIDLMAQQMSLMPRASVYKN